jgi:hypothetical protein
MKVGIEKANHQGHIKLLFKSWYKWHCTLSFFQDSMLSKCPFLRAGF